MQEKRNQQLAPLVKQILDFPKIFYILNKDDIEYDKLFDLLDLVLGVVEEYIPKDNYYDGRSLLCDIFEYLANISMKS